MNRSTIRSTLVLSALTLTAGCEKGREPSPRDSAAASTDRVDKSKVDARDTATTTSAYLVQQKENLQKVLGDRMADVEKQISNLKGKTGQASEAARSEWTRTLAELQQKKRVAAEKLDQLKESGMDKWQGLKVAAEAAFADLEKGLKDAFGRSKQDEPPAKP